MGISNYPTQEMIHNKQTTNKSSRKVTTKIEDGDDHERTRVHKGEEDYIMVPTAPEPFLKKGR
jgi:hypothetical protein